MTNQKRSETKTSTQATRLHQLGWNEHFDSQLAAMGETSGRVARIVSLQRSQFLVADGQSEWLCTASGRLLHSHPEDFPVTGDWVLTNDAIITGVISRRNLLSRGEAGTRGNRTKTATRQQTIAANLDTVFIVCGLDRDFNLRRLERYLTLIYNCGLSPVVVLTKADLHEAPQRFQAEVESIAFGVPVVLTSMQDGRGKNELESHLETGQTIAMLGSSGAGKSTLANMLYGKDIQLTADVSSSVGKGRHTTTARQLIRMPQGGLLMDNPGIREIAFHEGGDGVESTFADIQELAEMCHFSDCTHQHEPGCAVLHAVETGGLKRQRLENYRKMKDEMQYVDQRRTKSSSRVEKERWQGVAQLRKHINKQK